MCVLASDHLLDFADSGHVGEVRLIDRQHELLSDRLLSADRDLGLACGRLLAFLHGAIRVWGFHLLLHLLSSLAVLGWAAAVLL